MKEREMKKIADWITEVILHVKDQPLPADKKERAVFLKEFRKNALKDPVLKKIRREVKALTAGFPLFQS